MSETITLEPGAKVRQDGKAYKVTDTAVVSGELVEVKTQKNRHKLILCKDLKCRTDQIKDDGSVLKLRAGKAAKMPICPYCYEPMAWAEDNQGEGE